MSSNDLTAFREQQELTARNEAEEEYSHFLAHEVRNPLSGIDSSSLLILDSIAKLRKRLEETDPTDAAAVAEVTGLDS